MNDLRYLRAFNYINDNIGDLEENVTPSVRRITQTVVWYLLGQININLPQWNDVTLTAEEKAAVIAVIENYADYVGSGKVVDVLYMICSVDGSPASYPNRQPQIVPVFGTFFVTNELEDDEEFYGSVTFNKVKYGGELGWAGAEEFFFDLFKIVDGVETLVGTYPTDFYGRVSVEGLVPGAYVFREVWAVDHTTGNTEE
jgi:uncharacterized surface anchored protein